MKAAPQGRHGFTERLFKESFNSHVIRIFSLRICWEAEPKRLAWNPSIFAWSVWLRWKRIKKDREMHNKTCQAACHLWLVSSAGCRSNCIIPSSWCNDVDVLSMDVSVATGHISGEAIHVSCPTFAFLALIGLLGISIEKWIEQTYFGLRTGLQRKVRQCLFRPKKICKHRPPKLFEGGMSKPSFSIWKQHAIP